MQKAHEWWKWQCWWLDVNDDDDDDEGASKVQGWCKARLKWLSPSCWIGLEPASKSYVGSLQKLSTNTTICTTSVEYSSIRLFSAGKIKENFFFWWDSRQLKRYLVGNAEKWIAIDWLWWTKELLAIQLTTKGALAEEDTELQMTNVLIMETMIHIFCRLQLPPFPSRFPCCVLLAWSWNKWKSKYR